MRYKGILAFSLILLSILMIGAVSAAGDMEDLANSDAAGEISAVDSILTEQEEISESVYTDSNDILKAENDKGTIKINDNNYKHYFDENGTILENGKIADKDTIILENISNKIFKITKQLDITSNNRDLNNVSFIFNKGGDNSNLENIIIKNYGDMTAISIINAENITIASGNIHVETSNSDTMAVYVNLADNIQISETTINYIGKGNASGIKNAVRVIKTESIDFNDGLFTVTMPGGSIDENGVCASEAFLLEDCDSVNFYGNIINVVGSAGPALRAVNVRNSTNIEFRENFITASGETQYLYGVRIDGTSFEFMKGTINVINEGDNARCIEISPDSDGSINSNRILVQSAKRAEAIFTEFNNITLKGPELTSLENSIQSSAQVAYAMNLVGPSQIDMAIISVSGEHAIGIASVTNSKDVAVINSATITANGSKYDTSSEVTVGIYAKGNAHIINNQITSTGNYSIYNMANTSNITDNYLVSDRFLGDESVLDENGAKIKNNVPKSGADNYDITEDTFSLFFAEVGGLRDNITAKSLTFHGTFENLILDNDFIFIDRPIALLSDNATLCYLPIDIRSDNVTIDGFTFNGNAVNLIRTNNVKNITITNNIFILGDEDQYAEYDGFNVVINVFNSNEILVDNNTISLNVESNDTLYDKVIWAQNSGNVVISNNTIQASVPSHKNILTDDYHSAGISINDCDNVILAKNRIEMTSSFSSNEDDSIHGIYATGKNIAVYENAIVTVGTPWGYGIRMSVENFTVIANIVLADINPNSFLNGTSKSVINRENYSNIENASKFYEDLSEYGEAIRGNLEKMRLNITNEFAAGIYLESNSTGIIDFNLIGAAAAVSHGIHSGNASKNVKVITAFNMIFAVGGSVFGINLLGSEASVQYSMIVLFGNYTAGFASANSNVNITHNAIDSLGLKGSTNPENVGIYILSGNASITHNVIKSTGKFTVGFDGEKGIVSENILVADEYAGDASVDYVPGNAVVKNNLPKMERMVIEAANIKAIFSDDVISHVKVTDFEGNPLNNIAIELKIANTTLKNASDKNGTATFNLGKLDAGSYDLTLKTLITPFYSQEIKTVNVTVGKIKTQIGAKAITSTYNIDKKLVITLKDIKGNPLSNAKLKVNLNGNKYYTTDKNGQIKVSTKALIPKSYTAKVTFSGNNNCLASSASVKVTVKKATPKMTAKKKSFKAATKTKKYTITLKNNIAKAIKNAKVTLKVKGKTYKATTNKNGKATFKITKLTKKGTFNAVVKYAGDKCYNSETVNTKIIVK